MAYTWHGCICHALNKMAAAPHKLSYSYAGGNGAIRVDGFFGSPKMMVKADGKKYTLLEDEVFG